MQFTCVLTISGSESYFKEWVDEEFEAIEKQLIADKTTTKKMS